MPLVGTQAYVCVSVLSHTTIILLPSCFPPPPPTQNPVWIPGDCSVIPIPVHWHVREDLRALWPLQTLSPYIWHYIHAWMVVHVPDLWLQSNESLLSVANNLMCMYQSSLVPRPRTAFLSLAVRKGRESLVSFLTWAWRNQQVAKICRTNRLRFAFFNRLRTNAQSIRQSPPASHIRVVCYLVPWLFSLFYHPFYPDVTWEKIPGPLPLYRTESNGKLGGAWE